MSPSQKKRAAKKLAKATLPAAGDIEIGRVHHMLTYVDTPTHFGIHNISLEKAELAAICECGLEDKCWAVSQSRKPWPLALECCNKPGQPGHETHTSRCHIFSAQQLKRIRALRDQKRASQV